RVLRVPALSNLHTSPYTTLFRSVRDVAGLRHQVVGARDRDLGGDARLARDEGVQRLGERAVGRGLEGDHAIGHPLALHLREDLRDRKSTRLNSSHVKISYAVFCL